MKTMQQNRILTKNRGRRIAVIENERGEIGIDQVLAIDADEVFEMPEALAPYLAPTCRGWVQARRSRRAKRGHP